MKVILNDFADIFSLVIDIDEKREIPKEEDTNNK